MRCPVPPSAPWRLVIGAFDISDASEDMVTSMIEGSLVADAEVAWRWGPDGLELEPPVYT